MHFGCRIAEGIDPMTIVARGAALDAATAGLDARLCDVLKPSEGLAVRVKPSRGNMRRPSRMLSGRFHSLQIAADEDPH